MLWELAVVIEGQLASVGPQPVPCAATRSRSVRASGRSAWIAAATLSAGLILREDTARVAHTRGRFEQPRSADKCHCGSLVGDRMFRSPLPVRRAQALAALAIESNSRYP